MPPSLVIFDCDGVLVDSESIANEVMARFITDAGWPMTGAESEALFVGKRMSDVTAAIEQRTGRPVGADWLPRFEAARDTAFKGQLKAVDGIVGVLDRLQAANIATCVASSGSVAKMTFTLGLTRLLPRFAGRLFSSNAVPRGKPAPDIFLHAAESLKIPPVNCVVIEDSPLGAEAAQSAGMRCFGYAAAGKATDLQAFGATVFFRMDDLPPLIGI